MLSYDKLHDFWYTLDKLLNNRLFANPEGLVILLQLYIWFLLKLTPRDWAVIGPCPWVHNPGRVCDWNEICTAQWRSAKSGNHLQWFIYTPGRAVMMEAEALHQYEISCSYYICNFFLYFFKCGRHIRVCFGEGMISNPYWIHLECSKDHEISQTE